MCAALTAITLMIFLLPSYDAQKYTDEREKINLRRTPHINDENGGAKVMLGRSFRIWSAASVLLLGAQTPIPSRGGPLLTWSTWVPDLAHQYTASTLTPSEDITVTRMEAQVVGSGLDCFAAAVISVSNGTASVTLSIKSLANDTGPVNTSFVAGIPITVSVSSPASCEFEPSASNVVVHYNSGDR
jgi:hypothetical protein